MTSKILMSVFFLTSLWLISFGINASMKQAESPYKKYSHGCIYLAQKQDFYLYDFNNNNNWFTFKTGYSKECKRLTKLFNNISNNPEIRSAAMKYNLLSREISRITSKEQKIEKEYSNALLEKIANQDRDKSILQTSADKTKSEPEALKKKEKKLRSEIKKIANLKNYKSYNQFIKEKGSLSNQIMKKTNSKKTSNLKT